MLKKLKILMICILTITLVSGCSGTSKDSSSIDYEKLSTMVSIPTSEGGYKDGKKITFTAMLTTDKFDTTVENENKQYIEVMIARNSSKPIYVDVTKVKLDVKNGDVVTIDGKIEGYLYWTNEGSQEEVLNVVASSIKVRKEDKNIKVATDNFVDKQNNVKISFDKAIKDIDDFDKNIAYLYYNFENNNESGIKIGQLGIYVYAFQDDQILKTTIFSGSLEQPSNALKSTDSVDAGKKVYMYETYQTISANPIEIRAYDDNFNLIFNKTIEIK